MTTRHSYWKDWLAWVLAGTLGLGMLAQLNIMMQLGQPFPGFFVTNQIMSNTLIINADTPVWWPALRHYPELRGAVVHTINGLPYLENAIAEYRRAHQAGQPVTLEVGPATQRRTLVLPVETFTLQHMADVRFHNTIIGVGAWLLALVVYRTSPHRAQNRQVALLLLYPVPLFTLAFSFFVPWATPLGVGLNVLVNTLGWQWLALSLFLMGVTLPHPSRLAHPVVVGLAYATTIVTSLLWGGAVVLWHAGHNTGPGWLADLAAQWAGPLDVLGYQLAQQWLMPIGFSVAGLRWLWVWGREVWQGWRAAGRWQWRNVLFSHSITQRQATLLLMGVLFASGVAVPNIFDHVFWFGRTLYTDVFDWRAMLLAIPLMAATVTLRYKGFGQAMPNLSVPMLAGMFSAIVSGPGAWLSMLYVNTSTFSPPTPVIFGLVFLSLVFTLRQISRRGLFDRMFNQTTRNYQAAQVFGQHIAARPPEASLPTTLVAELTEQFNVARAALWVWDDTQGVHRLQAASPGTPPAALLPPLAAPASALTCALDHPSLPTEWQALNAAGFDALSVLAINGQALGVLAVSRRTDEETFDARDLEVLDLLAQQATLFLLAEHQLNDLKRLSTALEQAQEAERFRVAQDLHDTVQQSLNGLSYSMSLIQRYAHNKPERVPTLAAESLTEIHEAIGTLYQIRNALNLSELRHGLALPVRQMAQRYAARWKIHIETDVDETMPNSLPPQSAGAVYRVINQALDNVVAHARASQVQVRLWGEPERVWLEVRDNGRGFSPAERVQAEAGGHMGVPGMKTRLEGLGGDLQISSQPGAGTTVRGWVPVPAPGP